MRELYIQGKGKIEGEMLLGALAGLGADPGKLKKRLEEIFHFPVEIQAEELSERKYRACVTVREDFERFPKILNLEQAMAYFSQGKEGSLVREKVFQMAKLLEKTSNLSENSPFLALTGCDSSLVFLTALAEAMEILGLSRCRVSELEEGFGMGEKAMIPSEKILSILENSSLPIKFSARQGENFTPGSAAFLAVYGQPLEEGKLRNIEKWAWGISWERSQEEDRERELRAVVLRERAEQAEEEDRDQVQVLETNVDDCSGEQLGYAIDCLMKAGALDASCFPIFMKKGRPAYMLQVICKKEMQEKLEDIIFRETTSIGLRRYQENRRILPRTFDEVTLKDGHKVKIKICRHHDQVFYYPEYDTVRKVCQETGRPYRSVYDEAAALAGGYDYGL